MLSSFCNSKCSVSIWILILFSVRTRKWLFTFTNDIDWEFLIFQHALALSLNSKFEIDMCFHSFQILFINNHKYNDWTYSPIFKDGSVIA